VDEVDCHVAQYSFAKAPPRNCVTGSLQTDWVSLRTYGIAQGWCLDASPFGLFSTVLPYGDTLQVGTVSCRSDSSFLACADTTTKQGWTLSRAAFHTFSVGTCPSTLTLYAAGKNSHDKALTNVDWVHCSGSWAATQQDDSDGNAYTGVYHHTGSGWAEVDRVKPCQTHEIPASIYDDACLSN
jgi:hypothetical protein